MDTNIDLEFENVRKRIRSTKNKILENASKEANSNNLNGTPNLTKVRCDSIESQHEQWQTGYNRVLFPMYAMTDDAAWAWVLESLDVYPIVDLKPFYE